MASADRITGVVRVNDLIVEIVYQTGRTKANMFATKAAADQFIESIGEDVRVHRHRDAIYIITAICVVSFAILAAVLVNSYR